MCFGNENCVFGGTFNPIHNSHLYLVREFYAALELDFVLLIPTHIPPHKSAESLASSQDRLEMCRLACEDYSFLRVEDYEIRRGGKSYTYHTLGWLREQYPSSELFLLMGSDMYLTLNDWKKPEEIYRLATVCVIAREEAEEKAIADYTPNISKKGGKSIILNIRPKPMSSTEIRRLISEGRLPQGLLDPKVEEYIKKQGIYL